jgi:molybdopterin molybdotransferase
MQFDPDTMLTPEEAQRLILEQIAPLGHERVDLMRARDRVLAEDVQARADIPPWNNSAMDGYAVRHADIATAAPERPASVQMIDDIPAGTVGTLSVEPGQASRIMTGAPMPAGADTVIRVEYTRAEAPAPGSRIQIVQPEEPGANIRRQGEDMAAGSTVLRAGALCGPGEVGILAAVQRTMVSVFRRPRLAILSTGDELVEIDADLAPGRIVNSNSYSLAALASAHGAEPMVLPIARDSEAEIRRAVETALTADFIVSSGGVSVGEYDFVKKVLDDLGAETVLWRVAMKPGKPLFFAMLRGTPYFGVPGNPVSSMMSFLQFVRPAIRKASGHDQDTWLLPAATAVLETPLYNRGDRRHYMRATLRFVAGEIRASAPAAQGSHMLGSMVGSNGFIVLSPEQRAEPGDTVEVQVFGRLL